MFAFEPLSQFLDSKGFPEIQVKSGFEIIRRDFEKEYKAGNIRFGDDGIYLMTENREYRGYMFIKEAWITRYDSFPKFHLTKCSTIEEFIAKGTFRKRYEWSNSNVNDLIDITTRKIFESNVLDYCWNCREQLYNGIETTEDFFETLDIEPEPQKDLEVDIFGYTKDWRKISRKYRESINFTCESCNISIKNKFDHAFLHTHHINGNKTDNRTQNLKCLCILCHAFSDEIHERQFSSDKNKKLIASFVEKYGADLDADLVDRFNRKD